MIMQTVPYATVSNVIPGCIASFAAQGASRGASADGWLVDDAASFQTFASTYSGSGDLN